MNRLKSVGLALSAAMVSISFFACGTAFIPGATDPPDSVPGATQVPATVQPPASSPTPVPEATPGPTAVPAEALAPTDVPEAAPVLTPFPTGTLVPTPILTTVAVPTPAPPVTAILTSIPTTTPVPTAVPLADPLQTPSLPATPVSRPPPTREPEFTRNSAATNFNPHQVDLNAIGASATIIVETIGVDPEAQAVQVNVQHSPELQVSSPACAGIFTGGTVLPPAVVTGGTVIGCVLIAGKASAPAGPVMTFELTRTGNFNADQVVTFGLDGPLGTIYSESGISIGPGITNQLIVRP